jgi:hypothetical protein
VPAPVLFCAARVRTSALQCKHARAPDASQSAFRYFEDTVERADRKAVEEHLTTSCPHIFSVSEDEQLLVKNIIMNKRPPAQNIQRRR